jgi:hypothetical protein
MQNFALVLASIALTAFSWGVYGPLIRWGGQGMGGSHLLPFICVGVSYFLIAVLVPGIALKLRGEQGSWTASGIMWSLIAGSLGAVGALGVILALNTGGSSATIYVMPLVFGAAPVVNTFTTMSMSKSFGGAGPLFYAGLILVIAGAATVLVFNPVAKGPESVDPATLAKVLSFVALTAFSWGAYGPVLHKGQMLMQGSRLRPFICVGLAYFLIAVLVPLALRGTLGDHGEPTPPGVAWSLAGGAAGALGALGIILAFTYGGKPVFVMPLVFGGAPVINTLVSIATAKNVGEISPFFYAGLIVVVAGAATVLIFAPKPHPKPAVK